MILNEFIILSILAVHYLADFVMQTDMQARNKSSNNRYLADHVLVYSFVWFVFTVPILEWSAFTFFVVTFICHFCTDYVTSRMVKKYFATGNTHGGFNVIGLDQILHYVQLYMTFRFLL
ncbi:DUF3307 domain-containing protein [Dyadobacter sp. Leaf189]|uniref:DUF3307 domain-containing protein n=1 Tax=Dyadobacter sp. Leaf189 TaxID=1736295 RepID=UPI0006F8CE30|nr:hypothetical protein ASG33_07980 [Dyadobacter sp. Leaf189]